MTEQSSNGHALTGRAGSHSQPVVLSLGSNLGDRLGYLRLGLSIICGAGIACRAVSAVYETAPVGGPAQPDYLNAVLLADSSMPAQAVLDRCHAAEAAANRIRDARFGPRTLDVDIITFAAEVRASPQLTLPHPRAHERSFVLVPWLELDPDAVLPGWGRVADLAAAVAANRGRQIAAVRRRPDLSLALPTRPMHEQVTQCS